jgi:hypothetical protein
VPAAVTTVLPDQVVSWHHCHGQHRDREERPVGRRRGRRDNGLDAADYAAVGDLDPRVGEHLLDLLGARGIAAYLQPSIDVNPITRNSTVPARPVDRLYADRAHLGTAREFLRQLRAEEALDYPTGGERPTPQVFGPDPSGDHARDQTPNPDRSAGTGADQPGPPEPGGDHTRPAVSPAQFDATFAGIVAGFDRPVDPTAATWPSAENVAEPEPPVGSTSLGPVDARHITEPLIAGDDVADPDPSAGQPDVSAGEPADRFVPPPPPPLPRLSRQATLGALAVLTGLALVLWPGAGPLDRGESILLGFAALFGGAVALILRLRPGTDPDDQHPDDGARV